MKFYESNRRYVECDCCGDEILENDAYLKLRSGKYCTKCFYQGIDDNRVLASVNDIGDLTEDNFRITGGRDYYANEGDWYFAKQANFIKKYVKSMQLSDYPDEVKEIE